MEQPAAEEDLVAECQRRVCLLNAISRPKPPLAGRSHAAAYSAGLSSGRSVRLSCKARLARRSAIRSIIWVRTLRGFFETAGGGLRRTGGEIFSNVNAGIVLSLIHI